MKKCSYCGAEYPDDAVMCPIDQTPFEEAPSEVAFAHPPIVKRKIPGSLAVVSYLFFAQGAFFLVPAILGCIGLIALNSYYGHSVGSLSASRLFLAVCGVLFGIFCVLTSRGLRRCSPGWRTCALIFSWLGFAWSVVGIALLLFALHSPRRTMALEYLVVYVAAFIVLGWQCWILTRADIKQLFYSEP